MTTRENEEQLFDRGEIVLCYEPDPSKAKVLYDSKVLAVYERKGERNRRYFEYKIHFQGWNASWDRKVRADSLLKANEENRKLQSELAEAAQLQKSGGYSYKDTKTPTVPVNKKKRVPKGGYAEEQLADPLDISLAYLPATPQNELPQLQHKSAARSRDNSGGRKTQHDKSNSGAVSTADTPKKESRSAGRAAGGRKSAKSQFSVNANKDVRAPADVEKYVRQEDRVMLRISERLREYMEYDYNMIRKFGKQHALPARMPIVTILENFVKQRAVELAIGIKQDSSRARNTQSRNARMEREYDRVMSIVCMLKEVVDGLRIYFEFHLEDHLLYREEKEYVAAYLTEENLKNSSIKLNDSYDFINPNFETDLITHDNTMNTTNGDILGDGCILGGVEYEKQLQTCLRYIVKNSGKNNMAHAYDHNSSPFKLAYKLPFEMRGFLCETFNWRVLSSESLPDKSIIFGAPHLARMLVKLPEYLNASPISNDKLEDLMPHLDSFINYLENHKEWFDKENYAQPVVEEDQLQQEMLESLESPPIDL